MGRRRLLAVPAEEAAAPTAEEPLPPLAAAAPPPKFGTVDRPMLGLPKEGNRLGLVPKFDSGGFVLVVTNEGTVVLLSFTLDPSACVFGAPSKEDTAGCPLLAPKFGVVPAAEEVPADPNEVAGGCVLDVPKRVAGAGVFPLVPNGEASSVAPTKEEADG
jgi:hypothetical protein